MRLARLLVAVAIVAGVSSPRAAAQPANIILIRHGEKPDDKIDQQSESKEYAKLVKHVFADKDGLYKGKTLLIC